MARKITGNRQARKRTRMRLMACSAVVAAAMCGHATLSSAAAQDTVPSASAASPWKHYPNAPQAPRGAPNIIVVLTDDVGFAAASTFGGPIPTPVLDRLADDGLRYTRLHTTAMCSPTRAALLTGRNHHAVGNGSISNVSLDQPGYTSVIPASAATIGRVLKDNGYNTSWFGKNHNTPDWETGPMGPFDRWPNGMGFEYFYGFFGAGADQFNPPLIENRNMVRRDPADESYILDRDMTDRALQWIGSQHAQDPDKPFFLYYSPGTMHGPQQAPKEWVGKFSGKFDGGWDRLREEIFARQKEMGIIPRDAKLTPPLRDVPRWDSLSPEAKRLYARMMEVAAAQLSYFDYQFGRIVDRLEQDGELDNTLIVFVQGDNGAALHNMHGAMNAYSQFAGIKETLEGLLADYEKLGTEESFGNYPVGWAYALNTPYPWGKTVASHLGGLRDGMVISWPRKITDKGGIRDQFTHVIDIVPTIYEAIGITPPQQVDGVPQQPIDGVSMLYTFDNPEAPERHREQYFEMLGARSYYKDGWLAGTSVTWDTWGQNKTDPDSLPWELYNLNEDWSQTQNLAARFPEKLAELRADFDKAAAKFNIYPLSSDFFSRIDPKFRPSALAPMASRTYYEADTRYPAVVFPELSRTWSAVARITVADGAPSGPLLVQGSKFAGYSLRLEDGVPVFEFNPSGRDQERRILRGQASLGPGGHEITARISPAGESTAAVITLEVDGQSQASAPIDRVITIVTGEAMIGRPAIDDRTGPRSCGCAVESVTISTG